MQHYKHFLNWSNNYCHDTADMNSMVFALVSYPIFYPCLGAFLFLVLKSSNQAIMQHILYVLVPF